MKNELSRRLPDPFSKDYATSQAVKNRKILKIQRFIRYFAVLFVMAMVILVLYQFANQALPLRQQLETKEEVYLTVKPAKFNSMDTVEEREVANIDDAERIYYSKFYRIGSLKYRAAIAYWNLDEVPKGTIYKAISPLGALKEVQQSDRYDGIVFLTGSGSQEYFGRATFDDLIPRLTEKGKGEVRLKE